MLNKFTKMLDLQIITTIVIVILVSVIGAISVSAMFDSGTIEVTVTEINDFDNKNSTKKLKTKESDVGSFLDEHGLELGAYDTVNLDTDSPISDGTEIIITRGMPFTVVSDGNITFCSTTKTTVGEALLETGHFPDEDDLISADMSAPITPELTVSITRVNSETIVIGETIPNKTVYRDDNTLEKGKTKVIEEGNTGLVEVTLKVTYNNGVETSREEISRTVTREPKNRVIANGTKVIKKTNITKTTNVKNDTKATSASGTVAGLKYTKKLTMSATGYTAFRSDGTRGKTASGRTAGYGLVAVDPKVIPLGTRLYVEGYGEAIAADTGGAIKGNKIDLCFEMSNAEIRKQFGRKTLTVYVLE